MARVVTHAIKQASLNLGDFAEKKPFDINEDDIKSMLSEVDVRHSQSPSYTWKAEDKKPDALEGVIEQIKSMFDVGKEVESWSIKYYSPAQRGPGGKPLHSELRIPPIEKGMGGRFVIVVGSREVPTLQVSAGSTDAENQYLMLSGDCMYLKITICPVLNIIFSNKFSEKMGARKGFREMIIKKNPFNRHVIVVDAHVSITAVAKKVKDELVGATSEEVAEKILKESDVVAEMASKKDKIEKE